MRCLVVLKHLFPAGVHTWAMNMDSSFLSCPSASKWNPSPTMCTMQLRSAVDYLEAVAAGAGRSPFADMLFGLRFEQH